MPGIARKTAARQSSGGRGRVPARGVPRERDAVALRAIGAGGARAARCRATRHRCGYWRGAIPVPSATSSPYESSIRVRSTRRRSRLRVEGCRFGRSPRSFGSVSIFDLIAAAPDPARADLFVTPELILRSRGFEPGGSLRKHVHSHLDEVFIGLLGETTVYAGDAVIRLGVGETHVVPRGIPHEIRNESDAPSRLAIVKSPGDDDDTEWL
nr:cupin domain-containing protein [Schumannella luteola]